MESIVERIKEGKLLVGGLVGLLALIAYFTLGQSSTSTEQLLAEPSPSLVATSETTEASSSSDRQDLVVDVKGAVQKEGVYQLPAGSRVDDAIKQAGGLTENADKKSVNLAQKLSDGSVVYVASQGENISVVSAPTATGGSEGIATGKVNINRASLSELQTISGIGAKRAQDIIDYRETSGLFQSVDDLKKVSGIGDKTFDKIKELITVD